MIEPVAGSGGWAKRMALVENLIIASLLCPRNRSHGPSQSGRSICRGCCGHCSRTIPCRVPDQPVARCVQNDTTNIAVSQLDYNAILPALAMLSCITFVASKL